MRRVVVAGTSRGFGGSRASILNPGDVGMDDALGAKRDGAMRDDGILPLSDLLAAIGFLLRLSPEASFCEINLIPLKR